MSAFEYKTPSLITPLCRSLRRWFAEIQPEQRKGKILPSLEEDLEFALELTWKVGIEPELVIFIIAISSWWFRVYTANEADLKRALKSQLANFPGSVHTMTILDRYLCVQLSKLWPIGPSSDEEASEFITEAFQSKGLREIDSLARKWSGPFLVSNCTQLPPRRGGYPEWGPWVAAVTVHELARKRCQGKKDPLPLECADAILKAIRGREAPDKTLLYERARVMAELKWQLFDALEGAYQSAKTMVVQNESINPFVDEDCFPSLWHIGGSSLVLRKTPSSINLSTK